MAYENIKIREEAGRCLLCHEPACTKACDGKVAVDEIVRSLRFENEIGAYRKLKASGYDKDGIQKAMAACTRGKIDRPVDLKMIFESLESRQEDVKTDGVDLSIDFCGIPCENPFFLSSSVVGSNYEMVAKAFDMGWAGVAFKTIGFFKPDEVSPRFAALTKEQTPFVGFKNLEQISDHSLEENLSYLRQLKRDYPTKIIVASIMGRNEEEWAKLASRMEEVGADIIECNFSCPQMVGDGVGSDVGTNEELVRKYTAAVKSACSIPVLAKMTPNITCMEDAAYAAVQGGADGIAAINTIKSIMNVHLESGMSEPVVSGKTSVGGYSGKAVKPIALRFIYEMKRDERIKKIPISGMGGIESWRDAMEFLALGCENLQITTSVMQYGYRIIEDLKEGLSLYLAKNRIKRVQDIVGCGLSSIVPTEELDRKTIEYPKFDRDTCIGCGRCYISCYDGGHQALEFEASKGPRLLPHKCVGCQLCKLVCPVGAITSGTRVKKKE
ncbi:dihydropyrimidine dehydrogenase (NAD+) subunit PreA [Eubacterium oxidoreducens]|uniref:Dihydroorotate dehydrogenase B (NAD(+)), catalytic subunit n=2 Tax=Eubacterium oxidoreducens TaxID=1732 RepID=A0A1G6CKW4_EUBOX|nr:dihydropyrimidine dehydrogenase (NAD+) subunit PreA [Eubacterium oxidoreducens]